MTYRHVDDPSGRSPGAEVSVDPVDGWVWVHQVPTTRRAMPVVLMPTELARAVARAILADTEPPPAPRAPHSRACGVVPHDHGPRCARDCPTCHPRG